MCKVRAAAAAMKRMQTRSNGSKQLGSPRFFLSWEHITAVKEGRYIRMDSEIRRYVLEGAIETAKFFYCCRCCFLICLRTRHSRATAASDTDKYLPVEIREFKTCFDFSCFTLGLGILVLVGLVVGMQASPCKQVKEAEQSKAEQYTRESFDSI